MFQKGTHHKRQDKKLSRFQKKFQKGVDKSNRLWYNKDVPKGTKNFKLCAHCVSVGERGKLWLTKRR